ncbi:hypothetical protein L5515_008771 [Caenorhabditis briggsae]|uniref:Uncharacterized protein n=1 Tax=Caenorhabditis briggsae TaxID=6238 RepID=A0AAE9F746_CAEBR|nr:hypothetical protein L5515_008771 [Caenorhabditis briggsae]
MDNYDLNIDECVYTQLFHSLLVQSTLPLILMYLPTGIVFIFTMLNIELNINFGFIGYTIAIYPAIDPFPTIFIIKKYRERCSKILRSILIFVGNNNKPISQNTVFVTPVSVNPVNYASC